MDTTESLSELVEEKYYNRDLSWLGFNERLLIEAANHEVPLYERIKFLAIFSSNLDEFFRVRVASIKSLSELNKKKINKNLGFDPTELLVEIFRKVDKQQKQFGRIFREEILPALASKRVVLYRELPTSETHKRFIANYFRTRVLAYLQPVILKNDGAAHFLENRRLYFVTQLKRVGTENEMYYGLVNIPSQKVNRFLSLPSLDDETHYYLFLDDVIRLNIQTVFPGYEVQSCHSVKLNRDADLQIEDEYSGDLIDKIKKHLSKRHIGAASRFLYDESMPQSMLDFLQEAFSLKTDEMISGGRYHNFYDFFGLPNPLKPALQEKAMPAITHKELDNSDSFFDALDEKDFMLHFPYQSYNYVLRFFNEAAIDPYVKEIKVTVYRIASNSLIANALISAVKNGKKVTVFVEVKARFDEENNLRWAAAMEKAGVKIIYSIPGLKVHAKIALVTRIKEGKKKRYAFYGTGNFNEKTASIYADHGLFTANEAMNKELKSVFMFLNKREEKPTLKHLLVAQVNLQEELLIAVDEEITLAKAGKDARIIIKLNNLEDEVMINKLYEASQAGVKVDLIIRGICCLRPGVKGLSENIKAIRIVDMFLEHARVFVFNNEGNTKVYLGSADWMKRNLYRRIEVVYPVYSESIKKEILHILKLQLEDTTKAVLLNEHLENIKIESEGQGRAQLDTYNWLKEKM